MEAGWRRDGGGRLGFYCGAGTTYKQQREQLAVREGTTASVSLPKTERRRTMSLMERKKEADVYHFGKGRGVLDRVGLELGRTRKERGGMPLQGRGRPPGGLLGGELDREVKLGQEGEERVDAGLG